MAAGTLSGEDRRARLKRSLTFGLIMLFCSCMYTVYLFAFFRISRFFSGMDTYRDFFIGEWGTYLLLVLVIASCVTGYLFYEVKGLFLAVIIAIFAPLAVFFLTLEVCSVYEEWSAREKFALLSPEEQERILEEQLCLDYRYSSRGP
jgi:hypothetical protein